jgi:uncharacterized membrane protein
METAMTPTPADKPEILHVDLSDLTQALIAGWRDFRAEPLFGLFFAGIYVLGGWLIVFSLTAKGQLWWSLPASAGFPILGPFVACGLYEVSRRREAGERLIWGQVLGVVFRQKDRQIPSMAAVIVVFFLFWNFLAHMIFALFLGKATLTNITTSAEVFLTPEGLAMLAVVSLPMLLDREVDFVTAMLTSLGVVTESPLVMLGWGAVIGGSLFVAMLPGFAGLFVVLPVFGHATWHLYRRAIAWEREGP